MRHFWLWLACVGALAACGGSTKPSGGSGGDDEGGSGGTTAAGTSSGGMPGAGHGGTGGASSRCPSEPPKSGTSCTPRGSTGLGSSAADCSWGDDPRPVCRTRAVCDGGRWRIIESDASCSVDPKPAACPAKPATAGAACDDPTLRCWYGDGQVCSCSDCQGGSEYPICRSIDPPAWACTKPADGCPNPLPQAGSACSDPDKQCGTSCELPIRCVDGAWQYGAEMCPICASPTTPIATPGGYRAIAELRVGDLVYSVDDGAIVAVPVAAVASTPVVGHRVLRVKLDDGGVLEISPGHPVGNGQPLSSLAAGSELDEAHRIDSIELIPYHYDRTYDILPSSSTGTYFAAGALLGSTLHKH